MRLSYLVDRYLLRGFKITRIHADRKFELLRAEMSDLGIFLNCAYKKEHFPDIEQFNQTVKERVQSA